MRRGLEHVLCSVLAIFLAGSGALPLLSSSPAPCAAHRGPDCEHHEAAPARRLPCHEKPEEKAASVQTVVRAPLCSCHAGPDLMTDTRATSVRPPTLVTVMDRSGGPLAHVGAGSEPVGEPTSPPPRSR